MNRRHIATAHQEPTLFPFLAVLICTMGALIVLLVVMVQQARADAEHEADEVAQQRRAAQQQRQQEAEWERDEFQWKAELLQQSRQQYLDDLANQRRELSHLEQHIRELREQAEQTRVALDRLDAGQGESTDAMRQLEGELAEIQQQIADEETLLADEVAGRQHTAQSYALIPYDGARATERRPVYIECRSDQVVIQPTGVALRFDDFAPPMTAHNPLASALRATREYWLELDAAGPEAYPLIIVRPGGAEAYAAVRMALRSWDDAFGYELIPDEMVLAFPHPNPELTRLQQQVVEEARARLLAVRRARPNQTASLGVRASRRGGFVPIAADADALGGGGAGSSGDWNRSARADQVGWQRDRSGARRSADRSAGAAGTGRFAGSGGSPIGPGDAARNGTGQLGTDSHAGIESVPDASGVALTPGGGRGGTDVANYDPFASHSLSPDGRSGEGSDRSGVGWGGGSGQLGGESAGSLGGSQRPGTDSEGSGTNQSAPGRDGSASGAEPIGNGALDRDAAGGEAGSLRSDGNPMANSGSGGAAGMGGSPAVGLAEQGGSPSFTFSGAPSQDQSQLNDRSGYDQPQSVGSLAAVRGRNWGLPSRGQGAIPLVRPIGLRLYDESLAFRNAPLRQCRYVVVLMGSLSHLLRRFGNTWKGGGPLGPAPIGSHCYESTSVREGRTTSHA